MGQRDACSCTRAIGLSSEVPALGFETVEGTEALAQLLVDAANLVLLDVRLGSSGHNPLEEQQGVSVVDNAVYHRDVVASPQPVNT